MLWIWAVLPLVLAGSQLSVHTQDTDSISEGLKLRRRVRETDNCTEGLYRGGPFCCQPCQPGRSHEASRDEREKQGEGLRCPICKSVLDSYWLCYRVEHYKEVGLAEYLPAPKRPACKDVGMKAPYRLIMKHDDDDDDDDVEDNDGDGLQVETNCTPTQDTKCKCKPDFYCDSSGCEHCVRCASCEHGTLEPCTATSNTKCREQSSRNHLWFLTILVLPVLLAFIYLYIKYQKRHRDDPESRIPSHETIPMNVSNLSLSKYIPRIAEEMKIHEVRKFARENKIKESRIDEIKHDSIHDTAEQKIQLLQCWYQSHGKSGAYQDLIKGLKKAKCRKVVDKFQAMVQKDLENSTSDIGNENEGQLLE
ncbi:tumor necrosis factor receptor superfamily member 6 [Mus pahari]|uniref:tumor necrosis factor receptor superfamily member 6 n=1 Tax=Mus pahari TaxID=10093 RepID=UPI001114F5D2|nr:tumor necrosis factor receptor superfamily member 6 [Mus pahari]